MNKKFILTGEDKMSEIFKFYYCYGVCLLCVTFCWIGLEYVLEGAVHSSDVDGVIAVIFSWFIADKVMS